MGKQLKKGEKPGLALQLEMIAAMLDEEPVPINDRIMTMRLPLERKMYAILINVYVPKLINTEEAKEEFYSDLRETIKRVPTDDRLIPIGDFNARVGSDTEKWKGVLGSHAVGKCNANGELLLALSSQYNLVITNTLFKHKDTHKKTWIHPRSKHWHLLDYTIVRQRDVRVVLDTRSVRGADCGTDHVMLRSRVRICTLKQHCRMGAKPPRRLNTSALKGQKKQEDLTQEMDENLKDWYSNNSENNIEEKWATLKYTVSVSDCE